MEQTIEDIRKQRNQTADRVCDIARQISALKNQRESEERKLFLLDLELKRMQSASTPIVVGS
jgi:hypothetical protein